ncbi:MAG: radical SAM family heme chaperone HemW [Planctomycetota bacterium]|nr:radical SAM family heme chaperone HemW [Planctomycetota bacterium]
MEERTKISIRGQQLEPDQPPSQPTAARRLVGVPHPLRGLPPSTLASPVRSLYVHVPFCFHKCHYCDFYSLVDTRDRQAGFVERLEHELSVQATLTLGQPLRTIFFGGGTPSLLRVDLWKRLLAFLNAAFDMSAIHRGMGEFTVECNPETVTPELMATLRAGGVDRVSLGAQSFNPAHLKTLERWHDPANVARAIALARDAGIARQSIDLIFGIPGQKLADWTSDLEHAIALQTEHLSCYNLTYEPNTAMTARLKRGEFDAADEDVEVDMYETTLRLLRRAGMERYEVSNYAKPGAESQHNLAYWRQEQWLAAGPSASGHVAGHRWKNVPRLDDYLAINAADIATHWSQVVDHEPPDAKRALAERLMTGVRLREGVDPVEMLARAESLGAGRAKSLADAWNKVVLDGLAASTPAARWALNDAGILIADAIAGRLMAALDD